MKPKQICRRTFIKKSTPYLFFTAVIVAPGLIALKNRNKKGTEQTNGSSSPCLTCSWFSDCDLPEAVLLKQKSAAISENPAVK